MFCFPHNASYAIVAVLLIYTSGCEKQAPIEQTMPPARPKVAEAHQTPAPVEPSSPSPAMGVFAVDPEKEQSEGASALWNDDYPRAIGHLSRAIENWGDRKGLAHLLYTRGIAYEMAEQYDNAIADLTSAIEIEDTLYYRFSRGTAYSGKKDYKAALADFLKAAELGPNDYISVNAAASLLASTPIDADRDGPRALKLALHACELRGYRDHICLETLAEAYAETGDFQQAIEWQTKARDVYIDQEEPEVGPEMIPFTNRLVELEDRLELYKSGKRLRRSLDSD